MKHFQKNIYIYIFFNQNVQKNQLKKYIKKTSIFWKQNI